ncbi:ATP-binding cassette domain-containing protein [Akkermansiaceae bacterium]|nr:ATP-binding cassette domain-containing protein [Akkermansiaceae bacterium]
MGKVGQIFESLGQFVGRDTASHRELKTSRALLTIFASFIVADDKIEADEISIAFDFVRNIFPEANHSQLGRFLEKALVDRPILSPHLRHLKRSLTKEQKTAFALQLFALAKAGHPENTPEAPFLKIATALGIPKIGAAVVEEMTDTMAQPKKGLSRIDFSSGPAADVKLAESETQNHFRCYRAGGMILLRNLSNNPLWVRGYSLGIDRVIQLRPIDEIVVSGWRLKFDDLAYFFQNSPQTLFLLIADGEVSLSRSKSKSAVAQIVFGRRARVTALKESILTTSDGDFLEPSQEYLCDYHDRLSADGGDPIALESLRRLSLQSGHRFSLPGGRRKVIVSNDPSSLSGDSLLLTPGLSSRFVLELEFDPASGQGELKVIEASQTITANGVPVLKAALLDGSLIRLSSRQALRCRFTENMLDEERNLVRHLEVEGVNYAFWKAGKTLDNLAFHVERGEMICIIGPSGSGKSTLLEILAGQRRPQSGSVRLNGLSLYDRQSRLSPLISFMPQEEALSAQLTSREHLAHACAIRRPHLSKGAIHKRVNYLLDILGLDQIANRTVGSADSKSLSGGERSRLNAGLDLIGGGEIFIFDEPISGLSSKDAEHVVDSLKDLARDKIVITSLHRPSEKVLESFDRVLLLDRGGKMAFFGPPSGMIEYFGKANNELAITPADSLPLKEQTGADFVFDILEAPFHGRAKVPGGRNERRFPPVFWQERFENKRVMAHLNHAANSKLSSPEELPKADDQIPAPEPPAHGRRQKWMIFRTHLARALKSKLRHRGTFYSICLEAPLLSILIAFTLRASAEGSYEFHSALHLTSYIFLAVTVAMFFGLTNSASEILRDRPVLRRERNCRPHPILYLGSKFIVLTLLITLQSLVFIAVAHQILEIHDMIWIHLGWMTLTGCCGTAIALLISVLSKSERSALNAIPLILVPQILLAGALIPFGEMNRGLFHGGSSGRASGAEPAPSVIIPLRYAYEGAIVSQATSNLFEKSRRPLQATIEQAKSSGENEPLEAEKNQLAVLYAASANDVTQARTILNDPLAERERLMSGSAQEAEDTSKALPDFFVNQRVDGLVEFAETRRLDDRATSNPKVFLAEKKKIIGFDVSTATYCRINLVVLTLILMTLATSLLKYSLSRY